MEEQKAITYIPQTLASKTENSDLVLSLPYVDTELTDPVLKKQMQDLIKGELKIMRMESGGKKKDYLSSLPLPELPIINSKEIQDEIERVKKTGIRKIDLQKYESRVDPPEKKDDMELWDKTINQAKINYEYSIDQYFGQNFL